MRQLLTITLFGIVSFANGMARPESSDDNCPSTTREENLKLVKEFYQAVINDQNFDALDQYVDDDIIQHNPWVGDGKETLKAGLGPILSSGSPKGSAWELVRTAAHNDMVWLHSKLILNHKQNAVVDIYKIKCGKIVEHWDVIQEMSPSDVNDHAYF